MEYFIKNLKEASIIAFAIFGCFFLFSGFVFFTIKIDETKISETRYCPVCGIDLVQGR